MAGKIGAMDYVETSVKLRDVQHLVPILACVAKPGVRKKEKAAQCILV